MMNNYGNLINIKQKSVFITESHQFVLLAWAEYRKGKTNPPLLLSFDHHTDTHSAFLHYTFDKVKQRCDDNYAKELLKKINYNVDESVLDAVCKLRNDEHINTAIKSGIISKAFIVCYDQRRDIPMSNEEKEWVEKGCFSSTECPTRPYTYPQSDYYIIENICSIGCTRGPHDDECIIPHFNQAIETIYLEHKLSIMNEMLPGTVEDGHITCDYVLDIDLDYFHTLLSIRPKDTNAFYELINNASLITIAKETSWIDEWREVYEYDNKLDANILLEILLEHIDKAQS